MIKICLDPGHGGSDSGASAFGRKEKEDVLKIALKIERLLENQGVAVVMTRSTDNDITINERTALANRESCDYYLSLHRDAFSDAGANGATIYIYSKASPETQKKAQIVYDSVIRTSGFKNRGLKKGAVSYTDFGVNTKTAMPSALLELGFLTNISDNSIFDGKTDAIAIAIAKALCEITGVAYNDKTTQEDAAEESKKLYTVQAGAFSSRKNAEAYALKLKAAGFDAIIKET